MSFVGPGLGVFDLLTGKSNSKKSNIYLFINGIHVHHLLFEKENEEVHDETEFSVSILTPDAPVGSGSCVFLEKDCTREKIFTVLDTIKVF